MVAFLVYNSCWSMKWTPLLPTSERRIVSPKKSGLQLFFSACNLRVSSKIGIAFCFSASRVNSSTLALEISFKQCISFLMNVLISLAFLSRVWPKEEFSFWERGVSVCPFWQEISSAVKREANFSVVIRFLGPSFWVMLLTALSSQLLQVREGWTPSPKAAFEDCIFPQRGQSLALTTALSLSSKSASIFLGSFFLPPNRNIILT